MRPPVTGDDCLRAAEPRSSRLVAKRGEERAVRRLRAVPHHPGEGVEQHDRAALDERRPVAPEPERVTEPERAPR